MESSYSNSDDQLVTVSFKGLRGIYEVEGELEHGTELFYEQAIDVTPSELAKWVKSRERILSPRALEPITDPPLITKELADNIAAENRADQS